MKPILILGAGSWGTALALHLSRLDQTVYLWSLEKNHVLDMQKTRVNQRYLPKQVFPKTLLPTLDLNEALIHSDIVLIAVPSQGFRDILIMLKPLLTTRHQLLGVSKGLDENTGNLLHQTFHDILGSHYPYAVLSGPSFASEVAEQLPTAVVVASLSSEFAHAIAKRFNSSTFRVYLTHDLIGVEIGGAVKNVMAIATGISDGMGLGANARCALITRGLAEMIRLGTALGAEPETLTGLAGLGDLILTCTDNQSRNRRFGLLVGQGAPMEDASKEIQQVVEGKRNAQFILSLAQKMGVDMPITSTVCRILDGQISPQHAMQDLLSRATKAERE